MSGTSDPHLQNYCLADFPMSCLRATDFSLLVDLSFLNFLLLISYHS